MAAPDEGPPPLEGQGDDPFPFEDYDPTEPIVAYKVGRVLSTGPDQYRFAGVGWGANTAYDVDSTAECARYYHHAPHPHCGCGFWAVYELHDLSECAGNATGTFGYDELVRLTVEMSGPTELHDQGLRAYRQRVLQVAFPDTCIAEGCTQRSTALVVAALPQEHHRVLEASSVIQVCPDHIDEGHHQITPADVANGLSTEVTLTRHVADEGDSLTSSKSAQATLTNKFRMFKTQMFFLALMMALVLVQGTLLRGLIVTTSTSSWQDLSTVISQAATKPGSTMSYDNQPITVHPITANNVTVGATVFNLATNHCAVFLDTKAPQSYFDHLAPIATQYSTSYDDTTWPTYQSKELSPLRAHHPPAIVASLPTTDPQVCAATAQNVMSSPS
jgi:hypothetical protein